MPSQMAVQHSDLRVHQLQRACGLLACREMRAHLPRVSSATGQFVITVRVSMQRILSWTTEANPGSLQGPRQK